MLTKLLWAFKIRTIFVFILIHLGLALGIFALARESLDGWSLNIYLLALSIGFLYIGFLLAVFFIVWPLIPWIRRWQRLQFWTAHLAQDLPVIIEQLPKIIAAIRSIIDLWQERKNSRDPKN